MASPSVQRSNDENHSPAKRLQGNAKTTNRRVLGDVSPNFQAASPATTEALQNSKPLMGSPLKRSFTAAMEGGEGFTYLKKRKLSGDEVLSQVEGVTAQYESQFRPLLPQTQDEDHNSSSIPIIHEPPPLSPTEPNTPSSPADSSAEEDSSAERKSFSSLINYDPSFQTSNLVFKNISHAEILKLRLRVAMYKIRTNQVEVPFEDLVMEQNREQVRAQSRQDAVEEAVAELRREAQAKMWQQQKTSMQGSASIPTLLPAPVLRPTAYSSRMLYGTDLPSSPPVSVSPDRLPTVRNVLTPLREVRQLSSPPGSAEVRQSRPRREQELTSSVVKGRVAQGLLGLRHAV